LRKNIINNKAAGAGFCQYDKGFVWQTSNSGKRVEKVTITKQGSQYFAKSEGEPSIYELDGKAVEDLQKAASDVKEQPPAPPKK